MPEKEMGVQSNARLIEAFCQAYITGDVAAAIDAYHADDSVWDKVGRSYRAGRARS
jgi:limonene-1,2-epoxide hydrolase